MRRPRAISCSSRSIPATMANRATGRCSSGCRGARETTTWTTSCAWVADSCRGRLLDDNIATCPWRVPACTESPGCEAGSRTSASCLTEGSSHKPPLVCQRAIDLGLLARRLNCRPSTLTPIHSPSSNGPSSIVLIAGHPSKHNSTHEREPGAALIARISIARVNSLANYAGSKSAWSCWARSAARSR